MSNCKVLQAKKNAYIWDQKCFVCVFLGQNFQKLFSYLKSANSNLPKCKILWKKQKIVNLEPKMPYFGYSWARILKSYCRIFYQQPQIFQITQFCEKTKMPIFGTKKILLGYSWARILKAYCRILNQQPKICQTGKFCKKTKMPKFVTKNALFGYFWAKI